MEYLKSVGTVISPAASLVLKNDAYKRFMEEVEVVEDQIKEADVLAKKLGKRKYALCSINVLQDAVEDANSAFEALLGWIPTQTKKNKQNTDGWKTWVKSGQEMVKKLATQNSIDWYRTHLFHIVTQLQLALSLASLETNNTLLHIEYIKANESGDKLKQSMKDLQTCNEN